MVFGTHKWWDKAFPRKIQKKKITDKLIWAWLYSGHLKKETESFIIATQKKRIKATWKLKHARENVKNCFCENKWDSKSYYKRIRSINSIGEKPRPGCIKTMIDFIISTGNRCSLGIRDQIFNICKLVYTWPPKKERKQNKWIRDI